MSFMQSLQLLLPVHGHLARGRMAKNLQMCSVLGSWICNPLIPNCFLRWVSYSELHPCFDGFQVLIRNMCGQTWNEFEIVVFKNHSLQPFLSLALPSYTCQYKFRNSFWKQSELPFDILFVLCLLLLLCGQMTVPGLYDSSSLFHPVRGRSFDDSEPFISTNKQTGRAVLPDNNLLKSFAADKEKTSSVAKIKVVVCSLSLCFTILSI